MKRTFTPSQIIIHWLVFISIAIAYAAMELKGFTPKGSMARAILMLLHYTAGCTVLVLMTIRMLLKVTHRDPEIVPSPPRWQTLVSKMVHGVLYLMFITLPVLGIICLLYTSPSPRD